MAFDFNSITFNELVATNTTNYHEPTSTDMENGILPNTDLVSENINSLMYKCSAAIKQIQENGGIQYIPNKIYNEGNIVICNVVINNNISLYVYRCKENTVNTEPLKGMTVSDTFVYFTSNELLNDKWERVFVKNDIALDLTIDEFNKSGSESTDADFRYISLYDYNSVDVSSNVNTKFRITINRSNNILSSVINISYEDNNPVLNITEIFCNNYSMDSDISIWNSDSKFKDFALIGCFMYLNKTTNKFDLCIAPRNSSFIEPGQTINIKVEEIRGNVKLDIIDNGNTGTILDANIIKIPFINGAGSYSKKAFELFETFDKLTYEDVFKRGLVLCDENAPNDLIVYNCLGTSLSGRYGAKFLDFTDRYTASVRKQNYSHTNGVLSNKVDSLEYIEPQFTGVFYSYQSQSPISNTPPMNIPEGIWGSSNGEYYNINNLDSGSKYNGHTTFNFEKTWSTTPSASYMIEFDSSRSSSTYSPNIENDFFLDSTKVYRYSYFI